MHLQPCMLSLLHVMGQHGRLCGLKSLYLVQKWQAIHQNHQTYTAIMNQQYFTTITTNQSIALKHIDIKYYVVKDKIQDQRLELKHINIEQMLANLLTKGLPPNMFRKHVTDMNYGSKLRGHKMQSSFSKITSLIRNIEKYSIFIKFDKM